MDLSELEQACQKHKNHKQLPGVCSSCLRERLSKLYAASNKMKPKLEYSSSFSSSPHSSSTTTSKYVHMDSFCGQHYRTSSDAMGSVSVMLNVNYNLKKSRSIALASKSHGRNFSNCERKKDGFWSKFLGFTKRRN